MSDLVGNSEEWFYHVTAHVMPLKDSVRIAIGPLGLKLTLFTCFMYLLKRLERLLFSLLLYRVRVIQET